MTDEQRAREWLNDYEHNNLEVADLAALLARRALEEARWWEHLATQAHEESCGSKTSFDPKGCMYCERIAALEQAVAADVLMAKEPGR